MAKHDQSIFQSISQFFQKFDANPFEDFYICLVFRFLIYIYLIVSLTDILFGYAKPNLRTRVLRKFQYVYGEQILKEFDKEDMQELQVTINNTILNATKDLSVRTHKTQIVVVDMAEIQHSKSGSQSERRAFRKDQNLNHQAYEHYRDTKKLKIKFDLNRNDYYQPQSSKNSILESQEESNQQLCAIFENQTTKQNQVQGQSEEQNLSPTTKKSKIPLIGQSKSDKTQQKALKNSFQLQNLNNTQTKSEINYNVQEANIHYPEKQMIGIDPNFEQQFLRQQQDLLHLSEQNLYDSMIGREHYNQKTDEFQNFPSTIKTEATNDTETFSDELTT